MGCRHSLTTNTILVRFTAIFATKYDTSRRTHPIVANETRDSMPAPAASNVIEWAGASWQAPDCAARPTKSGKAKHRKWHVDYRQTTFSLRDGAPSPFGHKGRTIAQQRQLAILFSRHGDAADGHVADPRGMRGACTGMLDESPSLDFETESLVINASTRSNFFSRNLVRARQGNPLSPWNIFFIPASALLKHHTYDI